jgi:hypothetical protein
MLQVFPSNAFPLLLALLGAFGVTVIFTTGLLLDLLGSWFFRLTEMRIFVHQARRQIDWHFYCPTGSV